MLWEEIERYEKENIMPHMTSIEKRGLERGRAEMILLAVEERFGEALPEELITRIRQTTDAALFRRWMKLVFATSSLEQFQQRMQGRRR